MWNFSNIRSYSHLVLNWYAKSSYANWNIVYFVFWMIEPAEGPKSYVLYFYWHPASLHHLNNRTIYNNSVNFKHFPYPLARIHEKRWSECKKSPICHLLLVFILPFPTIHHPTNVINDHPECTTLRNAMHLRIGSESLYFAAFR